MLAVSSDEAKFGENLSHAFRPFAIAYCECFNSKCP